MNTMTTPQMFEAIGRTKQLLEDAERIAAETRRMMLGEAA